MLRFHGDNRRTDPDFHINAAAIAQLNQLGAGFQSPPFQLVAQLNIQRMLMLPGSHQTYSLRHHIKRPRQLQLLPHLPHRRQHLPPH